MDQQNCLIYLNRTRFTGVESTCVWRCYALAGAALIALAMLVESGLCLAQRAGS